MDKSTSGGRPALDDNAHDDQILAVFWAQMQHGRPLSETQARHLFRIGFEAGHRATLNEVRKYRASRPPIRRTRPWFVAVGGLVLALAFFVSWLLQDASWIYLYTIGPLLAGYGGAMVSRGAFPQRSKEAVG